MCTQKLSHNEAKGCQEKGGGRGGYKWKDVRYYGRGGGKAREADELDKEQKQRDGENKRFSACPRSAATARRQAKAVATVSTNLEFKGH